MEVMIYIGMIVFGIYGFIYSLKHLQKNGNKVKGNNLITDMEIKIAQLEIRPKSNKSIKIVADYLEKTIMPNEELLAIGYTSNWISQIFAIITDKRVILKSAKVEWVTITPIEKVTNLTQSGAMVFINQTWVNLLSVDTASKFINIINTQIAKNQVTDQTIKIENKITTEETIVSQLQKLSNLHEAKVLTDYEYSIKKQELLNKMK